MCTGPLKKFCGTVKNFVPELGQYTRLNFSVYHLYDAPVFVSEYSFHILTQHITGPQLRESICFLTQTKVC